MFSFKDFRISEKNILLGEGKLLELRSKYMPGSKAESAATVLGVGRAAYEYAFDYAKNRKQGGKFIIEHQAISLMLAKMIMLPDGADFKFGRLHGSLIIFILILEYKV